MLGLHLAEEFYREEIKPLLDKELPSIMPLLAIGLVGEGSECLGFDDNISQDHDYGVSLCFWLPEKEIARKETLERVLLYAPKEYAGLKTRIYNQETQGRHGVLSIEAFYGRYIGQKEVPETWQAWRGIPEHFLATATNGRVFYDAYGEFTKIRNALLEYYPEDIRLKKIAARCAIMAQAGQYNLLRAVKRGQHVTSMLAIARFAEAALSLTFLLNKSYMPFYKWANTAVQALPLLGEETALCLEKLSGLNAQHANIAIEIIEEHCQKISHVLHKLNLSSVNDSWLLAHASEIQSKISIPQLRALPEMAE